MSTKFDWNMEYRCISANIRNSIQIVIDVGLGWGGYFELCCTTFLREESQLQRVIVFDQALRKRLKPAERLNSGKNRISPFVIR